MKSFTRALRWLVWAGIAFYLALTLWLGFVGLVYPYQLDYGEGIVLWFTRQIAHGAPIYKALEGAPYASSNYPPVALLLSAALTPIFGAGYTGGRWLNFASALVVAAIIFRITRVETRHGHVAALAASFFLASPYVYHWIPLFRVDLVGLAFAVGGVFFVWRWEQRPSIVNGQQPTIRRDSLRSTVYGLLFTGFFLLALYTKHTLFAAPAAAFLAIWARDRRAALAFALALGALGGTLYLALDLATRGAFTFGLITSNATVFLPEQLLALLKNFALTFGVLILFAAWELIQRARARRWGVLEWYALTSFAFLALAGRVGAWENYFFEAIVAASIYSGFRISDFGQKGSDIRNPKSEITNYQLLVTILLLLQLALYWHDPRVATQLVAEELPANQQLAALLARTPDPIISEDMGALVTSGKPVAYYTFQYSSLARSGKWDQSWELTGLRDELFPLVVLQRGTRENVDHYRRFTREFVSALDRSYARAETFGKYEIYRPARLAHWHSAQFGDAIAIVGWDLQPATLKPEPLKLVVLWQARRALARRYTAFAHLENEQGLKITQSDQEPRGGIYPTTGWAAEEMVRETYTLIVPSALPRGKYVLKVGWYDSETGERLSVAGSADDALVLATLEF